MTLKIYTLANCDTCRKAVNWLRAHKIQFVEKPIRETPPTVAELRAMLAHEEGQLRRLTNTAGLEYRKLGLKERLHKLGENDALALLAVNGRLVKRPFLIGPKIGLVGFDETRWKQTLA